jgi:5-methylcytosine-specific restriction protein A
VCLDSPPGFAAAGFCMLESLVPVKLPVHRPVGVRSAAEVKRALDRKRPSAARRGYGLRWRRARRAFLASHPLCAACQAQGRVVPATVIDHAVPHRGDPKLFWDESNWAALCKRCHDAKTAREGRWGGAD